MPPSRSTIPDDVHEWISFEDPEEDRTWIFDATFLMSNWTCIYGRGCPGVLTEAAPELEEGCCSYGAHFTGEDDRANVEARLVELTDDEWQYRRAAAKRGGAIYVNRQGETVSRVVDGACIFLNRPGHPSGAGCALHQAAVRRGQSILHWKPEVCWQAPLRRHDETDVYGHVTSTVREWKRRDWGPGGHEFHWWCTDAVDDANAFIGHRPVHEACREELVEMCGAAPVDLFLRLVQAREAAGTTWLPHPATRRR
jgi:hypothetical protein